MAPKRSFRSTNSTQVMGLGSNENENSAAWREREENDDSLIPTLNQASNLDSIHNEDPIVEDKKR